MWCRRFEYLLSIPAAWVDKQMVAISALPYAPESTVIYMRLTVILSDLVRRIHARAHAFVDPHSRPRASSGAVLSAAPVLPFDVAHEQRGRQRGW